MKNRKRNPREHISDFLRAVLEDDPEAQFTLREVTAAYRPWCEAKGVEPLADVALSQQLREFFWALMADNVDLAIKGAKLRRPAKWDGPLVQCNVKVPSDVRHRFEDAFKRAQAAHPELTKGEFFEVALAAFEAAERPKLVASSSEGAGSIPKILHEILEPAAGGEVEVQECHAGYAAQCLAAGRRAVPPVQFVDPLVQFCRRAGIRTKTVGDRFYLLDVQLAADGPAINEHEEEGRGRQVGARHRPSS
jgi:hypothetical protein